MLGCVHYNILFYLKNIILNFLYYIILNCIILHYISIIK